MNIQTNTQDPKIKRLRIQVLTFQQMIKDLERKLRAEQRKTADLTRTINKMKREQQ